MSEGSTSPTPIVSARGLHRVSRSGARTLLEVDTITLEAGDCVGVVGPSGGGKTLLLRSLALLDAIETGQVEWLGHPVARDRIPDFRADVMYLHQRPAVLGETVREDLERPFTLSRHDDSRSDPSRQTRLLEAFGRGSDFLSARADELSGGEAQIVALVRVLQLDPSVLLLDEPTASLDPETTRQVETVLSDWLRDGAPRRGAPRRGIIWVSHDEHQARRVSTRVLEVRDGKLQPR